MLSAALWIGALAAAVLAVVQLSRQSTRLRDELEELRSSLKPAAETAPKSRSGSGPMFGGLYETKASPFESLAAWPGVIPACAAAILLSGAALSNRPVRPAPVAVDSATTADLALVRLQYDSLSKRLAAMHDSMAVPHLTPGTTTTRAGEAIASRKPAAAVPTRKATTPAASGVAPLPAMPKVTP